MPSIGRGVHVCVLYSWLLQMRAKPAPVKQQ